MERASRVTERASNCQNCGAPVTFQWSSSVQAVCPYCKSILVRTDVDLKKVGEVADLPPDSSPFQINSEGVYAQDEYAVTTRSDISKLPSEAQAALGQQFQWNGVVYSVTTRTVAHYAGVEGELPFEKWKKEDEVFIDLRSQTGDFATLDYSGEAPVLYLGKIVDFDTLRLANLRRFEGW